MFFPLWHRFLAAGSRHYSPGGIGELRISGWNDGRHGLSYAQCRRLGMVAIGVGGADAVDVMTGDGMGTENAASDRRTLEG